MSDEPYSNIRELLGDFIGCCVVDITQHDEDEFKESGDCYVALHFDNGGTITFDITDDGGFHVEPGDEFQGNDE